MKPFVDDILSAYSAALGAVDPTQRVKAHARAGLIPKSEKLQVLAIGKAAPKMVWGLVEAGIKFTGLGVTVEGVQAPQMDGFRWLAGEHPAPGPSSYAAGEMVQTWAKQRTTEPVLVLLSGGGSSCVEVPAEGHSQASVTKLSKDLVASGEDITRINRARSAVSALKGGKLGRLLLQGGPVHCLVVQDAPDPRIVSSGPVDCPEIEHVSLADNDALVAAAGLRLGALGYAVYRHPGRLDGPVDECIAAFAEGFHGLEGDRVALVGGGEPTIALPGNAPQGGRATHSALAMAPRLPDGSVFAALASDGIDGSTKNAGAWAVVGDANPEALADFTAFAHLDARDRTILMGPTGTNVNDLWIGLRTR